MQEGKGKQVSRLTITAIRVNMVREPKYLRAIGIIGEIPLHNQTAPTKY
jgi:hypothetical protein